MKVAIFTHPDNTKIGNLTDVLNASNIDYTINPLMVDCSYTMVITLGGDGTLLNAVRQLSTSCTIEACPPLLGINSGRLGFLATVGLDEIPEAVEAIKSGDYTIEKRTMLEVTTDGVEGSWEALNEFTAQRSGVSMIEFDIIIDGVEVSSYWADGVIISTPTGSTAYSMSVGGAIVAPNSPCFILSPVSPHNLSLRPLVTSDSSIIDIEVRSRFKEGAIITVDNTRYEAKDGQRFRIAKSKNTLSLVHLRRGNFYDTLRKKLNWGIDVRA